MCNHAKFLNNRRKNLQVIRLKNKKDGKSILPKKDHIFR